MKGSSCPCPALPHFGQLGSRFMAEGSRTQAPGEGPPVSIQLLRAQYEGLRRQQRAQAHLVVLPKGGNMPAPTHPMVSAIWINREERHSQSQEEAASEAEELVEEDDRHHLEALKSPWHTHLEMHRLVHAIPQGTNHQEKHRGKLVESDQRLPLEGQEHLSENNWITQHGTPILEAAQLQCQAGNTQTKAVESGLKFSIPHPPSIKHPHRSGKPAHYPFPQRKTPRISQAARNLGLYGPA
ncbi:uncharacterized protein C9orf152 homolog [Nycticebus coucang]|uniref:uncharacterized protein C9orf152 homolog n=1 Tax=Nycticebus coucang TaxID=9470 RepID=UPI00234C83E5|nr:uncharacterized protein C9orf152 homolog [Nycticebus coucang]